MHKQYLSIIILGILVAIVCITGFSIIGSPISQRGIKLDQTRMSDFASIKSEIENYYSLNKILPQSLSSLTFTYAPEPKDPESKQSYTYEKISDIDYKLCTTFSTDSEEVKKKTNTSPNYEYYYDSVNKSIHKKGYDCITYQLPKYLMPSPTPNYLPSNLELYRMNPSLTTTPSYSTSSAQ